MVNQDVGHDSYIKNLRLERDALKAEIERLTTKFKSIDAAIEHLERAFMEPAPARPTILVRSNQFNGGTVPAAIAHFLLTLSNTHTSAEMGSAVYRGGLGESETWAITNARAALKLWRRNGWLELDDEDKTWHLTSEGRARLTRKYGSAASGTVQADEQSLFSARK